MNLFLEFFFILSLLQFSTHNIIDLSDENFNEIVMKSEDAWFIKFYSFSCQHCQKFAPTFEELAQSDLQDKIKFGEVECEFNTQTADEFEIRAYPTLKFFKLGKKTKTNILRYSEVDRTFEGLSSWLNEKYNWNLKNYNQQKAKEVNQAPKEPPHKAEIINDKEIYILEESNFYDFIFDSKVPTIIHFTSHYCFECEQLNDKLKLFAKQNIKNMKVATINAELFPSIAIKYHIISYPTVKLFSEKYEGKELSTNMTTLKDEVFKYIKNTKNEL